MKTTTTTNHDQALADLGFTLSTDSGPTGGVDKDWPHIAYTVTLALNGKPVVSTPYKLGVGHVDPKGKSPPGFDSMLETWKRNPLVKFADKSAHAALAAKLAKAQGVKPELANVLYSLMLDGDAYFSAQPFEDWAMGLGYDPDSRTAEGIWKACDAIGRALAGKIPADTLAKVREILADH